MVCRLVIYSGIISSDLYTYISSNRINIYARDRICTYTFSIRSLHIFLYRDRISDLYSYILSDRINIWYRDQFWMICRIVRPLAPLPPHLPKPYTSLTFTLWSSTLQKFVLFSLVLFYKVFSFVQLFKNEI